MRRRGQRVFLVGIGASHTLAHHVGHRQRGLPAHVHADFQIDHGDAGVLADRAVALGGHPRIDQNLRDGIFCRRGFFVLVRLGHCLDEINRVVVGDELVSIGDALDEIFLFDGSHRLAFIKSINQK